MRVLRSHNVISVGSGAEIKKEELNKFIADKSNKLVRDIEKSLAELHGTYSPELIEEVAVAVLGLDQKKAARMERMSEKYAKDIIKYYRSFGVLISITSAEYRDEKHIFTVKLRPGAKTDKIIRYAEEVRRLLEKIAFFLPVVETNAIKIDMSENDVMENSLMKILQSPEFMNSNMKIPYAMGYDILGEIYVTDLEKFPHLLLGGTTGGGKSTALHSLLMSIAYKQSPEAVEVIILDFGSSELEPFGCIPHMMQPIVTDMQKGLCVLKSLRTLMEERIALFGKDRTAFEKLPYIVCIIDEFPAFVGRITSGKGNKRNREVIQDLLQRGRKSRVHMVLAAQDPIKENMKISTTTITARMAFRCASKHNSRAILEYSGAEGLTGIGTMYFVSKQHTGLNFLQGSYMDEKNIKKTLKELGFDDNIKKQLDFADVLSDEGNGNNVEIVSEMDRDQSQPFEMTDEELLANIIMLAFRRGEISKHHIENKYKMGYGRAKRYIDKMEDYDLIERKQGKSNRARKIKPKRMEEITNQDIINFLTNFGYTLQEISEAVDAGANAN